jgi:peptidase E
VTRPGPRGIPYGASVASTHRQIFAFSGVLSADPGRSGSLLVAHALSLAPRPGVRRVCYIPTAVGDAVEAIDAQRARVESLPGAEFSVLRLFPQPSVPDVRAHLLSQDLILVEGGSVVNLLAVWRAHGLPSVLRECWESGVVLAGASAGSLCWHLGGPTDSFQDSLDPFTDGLGFLPYSNGVHDDFGDQPRRETYRKLVADGALAAGYATEDGVGLHYVGTDLHEAVSIRSRAVAWWVEPTPAGGWAEKAIEPRQI